MPAGFLVFLGLIGTLSSINDCLIQFQLLPCGAVQPLDFFDHIVGVGSCDTLAQLFPAFLGFGVMHHHFNGGTLSHGSLTSGYIAITSFLRVTGCPLFAAVSAQNIQGQTDQQSHINAKHLGLGSVVAHTRGRSSILDCSTLSNLIFLAFLLGVWFLLR